MRALTLFGPLAWRNLWRNPRRTLITLAVVAVGVWSILTFDVLLKAFGEASREGTLRLLTGEAQIHAPGWLDDPGVTHRMPAPAGALAGALAAPPVTAAAARVRVPAIVRSEYRTRAATLLGVAPDEERRVSDLPGAVSAGRYLSGPADPGAVIGRDLATRLKTRLGKRIILMTQAADGRLAEQSFTIVGLYASQQSAEDEYVFTGRATAQAMLGIGTDVSEIAFDATLQPGLEAAVAKVRKAAPGLDVKTWMQLSPLAYTIETFTQSYVAVWLMIMFVLMAIGIVNTQLMAVFERTREFGLMQALGMGRGLIVLQVSLESALLIGLGVVAGAALMLLTLAPFGHGLDLGFLAPGAEMAGIGRVLHPKLAPGEALGFCGLVWVLGILAALWPARTAAKATPAAAMAAQA